MRWSARAIVFISVAGLALWLFADALLGGPFLYRDAAHFYYPLFRYIADEWAAGRLPLWNPYENLGIPLAANPAASVFYPGKLIFALPIAYGWAYKIYILGHLLLAAAAAYRLARRWHASVEAAGLCALSYAFSGNVLFDYSNVVFLVGAAWLPLGMLAADRALRGAGDQRSGARAPGRIRWAVAFGVVLAMMVLGGDPQMAYNAGLLAGMYALWLWWDEGLVSACRRLLADVRPRPLWKWTKASGGVMRSRLGLLATAAVVGLALSAVQVLPALEFTQRSGRTAGPLAERLPGRIQPGTHTEHTYHFSVGPWRLAEYVWPNVSGRPFPDHRRWLNVIPAEGDGNAWTPSLYMGLLPLLLAVAAMRLRRPKGSDGSPPKSATLDRWLSWTVVLAVLGSFGWFGLGWLADEVYHACGGDPAGLGWVGAPTGGAYWLMTVVLPGYARFRYPAKLLVVAALGLSALAARGFDRLLASPAVRFRRVLLILGGVSLCGAAIAWAILPVWGDWLQAVQPDPLFGPFDARGAALDLTGALLHSAILCGLFWLFLAIRKERGSVVHCVLVLLTAIDLGVANRWMIVCGPAGSGEGASELSEVLRREEASGAGQPFRILRHPVWIPPTASPQAMPGPAEFGARRMARICQWDRDTLWPKYNLGERISLAQVLGTMSPRDYELFFSAGTHLAGRAGGSRVGFVPFRLAKYLIVPGRTVLSEAERVRTEVPGVSLWRNPDALPRAWIVHDVDVLPPLETDDLDSVWQRTADVLCPEGRPRDLLRSAVVETTSPIAVEDAGVSSPLSADAEMCRVVRLEPSRVEIEAELAKPGLVILADQFFPGWELRVETEGQSAQYARILRANRVMRGVWLPGGRHRLTYAFRPRSLAWGATISGLAWLVLALVAVVGLWRRSRWGRVSGNGDGAAIQEVGGGG